MSSTPVVTPPATASDRRPWLHLAAGVVVALVTVLAYSNAAPNALVHDDRFFFPQHRSFSWRDVGQFFVEDTWAATGAPSGVYRPLLLTSLAADQWWHADEPAAFHRTNILLHVAATLLLYALFAALLGTTAAAPATHVIACAALAAGLFGVHPIHTEAVDSIFNRSEILVTIAVAAALWILVRLEPTRPVLAWTAAAAIYFAALLCRESAATLPVLAALMLAVVTREVPWPQRRARLAPVVLLAVPLAAYLLLRRVALAAAVEAPVAPDGAVDAVAGWAARLAETVAMMCTALRMIVWPHPLQTSYIDLAPPGIGAAIGLHALLAAAVVLALLRLPGRPPRTGEGLSRRRDLIAFAIVAFYVTLLPSTRLFTNPAISVGVAERYVYLPSAFATFGFAVGLLMLAERRRAGLVGSIAIGALLIAACVPLTYRRNDQWHSAEQLFAADFEASGGTDALRLLTGAYLEAARHRDVVALCDEHLASHPGNAKLANHCGSAYAQLARTADAEAAYRQALAIHDIDAVVHANLGRMYARLNRAGEAEQEFLRAAATEPLPARRHWRTGQAILGFHADDPVQLAAAESELAAAVRLDPTDPQYVESLRRVKEARRQHPIPAPPAPVTAAAGQRDASLSPAARARLVESLAGAPPGSGVWILYDARYASARALADALVAAFGEAHWELRRLGTVGFPLRPGVYLFASDEPPAKSATDAARALQAAELAPNVATGYRAFADERRRTQPGWRGIELAPDQEFVIAVGRPPEG